MEAPLRLEDINLDEFSALGIPDVHCTASISFTLPNKVLCLIHIRVFAISYLFDTRRLLVAKRTRALRFHFPLPPRLSKYTISNM